MGAARQSPFDVECRSRLLEAAVPRVAGPADSPCSACAIRHLTICAGLQAEELHQLAAIVTNQELDPGQGLFDECEPARNVYNVTAGTMKIYKLLPDGRCQITGFLFPGDFLGLANKEIYAFSAEAVNHVVLCRFNRRKLEDLLERVPGMEKRLLAMASHELAVAQEQMLLLGRKSAKERVASFLLMLSGNAARRGQANNPVSVPMSRADIGDFLGLTTETVSRTFTQLRKTEVISLEPGGSVNFLNREALSEIAEGF